MTDAGRRYFSGDSLEQAIMQAARHHGIKPEEVAFRKIEKRHGFLKIRRGVVIEVDPNAPRQVREAAANPSQEPSVEEATERASAQETPSEPAEAQLQQGEIEPRADSADRDLASDHTAGAVEAAGKGLGEILNFARLDLESEIRAGEGQLEIELRGADRSRLVEKRGELLLAIQHLLPRLIRGYTGRSAPCRVDSEGFHASRKAELENLAAEVAEEVRRRQQPRTLPPMNPAERRIIHLALADDTELVTESHGRGFFKRVTIRPAMRRPRGFDRYRR